MNIKYFATPFTQLYYPKWQEQAIQITPMALANPIVGKIEGLDGFAFDFNCGLRLQIPFGDWHVKISDFNSKTILFDDDIQDSLLISFEKFYIKWEIEITSKGQLLFHHIHDLEDRQVYIKFISLGMGDMIEIMPCVETFRRLHKCEIFVEVYDYLVDLFKTYYPKMQFTPPIYHMQLTS